MEHHLPALLQDGTLAQWLKDHHFRDYPGGPVVKNPPSSAGDMGSIPGQGTKIPHVEEQLSPEATTRESVCRNKRSHMVQQRSCVQQLRPDAAK